MKAKGRKGTGPTSPKLAVFEVEVRREFKPSGAFVPSDNPELLSINFRSAVFVTMSI